MVEEQYFVAVDTGLTWVLKVTVLSVFISTQQDICPTKSPCDGIGSSPNRGRLRVSPTGADFNAPMT